MDEYDRMFMQVRGELEEIARSEVWMIETAEAEGMADA